MAWQIVKHAFAMIFNNFGQAVKVSVIPFVILMAVAALLLAVAGVPWDLMRGEFDVNEIPQVSGLAVLLIIALVVFAFFTFGWIAVSWHRFILREEYTALIPAVSGRPIWGYVGKSILLGLLLSLIAIPVSMLLGLLFFPLMGASAEPGIFAFIFALVLGSILGFLWFRWAISLPAKAVGEDMTFSTAWATTAPLAGIIFQVTLITVALNLAASFLLAFALNEIPAVSLVLELAVNWLSTMIGISVLTTLYGHLVEGRPLAA